VFDPLASALLLAVLLFAGIAVGWLRRGRHVSLLDAALPFLVAATVVWLGLQLLTPVGRSAAVGINLVPFHTITRQLASGSRASDLNLIGNVAFFVPLGFLTRLWLRRTALASVAVGMAVSIGFETLQGIADIGRVVDIDDVILNTLGVAIGVAGAALAMRLVAVEDR
jgi:glycopeptide antibiotics resistance protein